MLCTYTLASVQTLASQSTPQGPGAAAGPADGVGIATHERLNHATEHARKLNRSRAASRMSRNPHKQGHDDITHSTDARSSLSARKNVNYHGGLVRVQATAHALNVRQLQCPAGVVNLTRDKNTCLGQIKNKPIILCTKH